MIEQDTIKLLRECDAGVKMGVSSIEDVLGYVSNSKFEKLLTKCKKYNIFCNMSVNAAEVAFNTIAKGDKQNEKAISSYARSGDGIQPRLLQEQV